MLTAEQKNRMIDDQIKQYQVKIFQLEMVKTALFANDDVDGVNDADKRIEALRKAITAVTGMKEV
jgi:hypothetical protein